MVTQYHFFTPFFTSSLPFFFFTSSHHTRITPYPHRHNVTYYTAHNTSPDTIHNETH